MNYEDIIHLPHHVSAVHPQMPRADRAAQFASFAALTGYDAVIKEAGRLTEKPVELGEDQKKALDDKLRWLYTHQDQKKQVAVTYFQPDARKHGGSYKKVRGSMQQLDPALQLMIMADKVQIPLQAIIEIELL